MAKAKNINKFITKPDLGKDPNRTKYTKLKSFTLEPDECH